MKAIVAYSIPHRYIGNDGGLLWHYKEDLQFFKQQTLNQNVIMGHNTYLSIGKPLSNRNNYVISRNKNLIIPGVNVISFDQAIKLDGWLIGGEQIYKQAFEAHIIDELYATEINQCVYGNKIFPDFDYSYSEIIKKSGDLLFMKYKIRY
jgi:dihydrofolate reductase